VKASAAGASASIALPNNTPAETGLKPTAGFGVVTITSEPDGAEIYLDGKFVGNTPGKLKIPAGTHSIVLKSSGHVDWQRALEVLKDSNVALIGELSAKP
jgi:hypothetical protein